MSVVSENAIVITATLDTEEVTNGVERINSAIYNMEKATDDALSKVLPALRTVSGDAGKEAGDSFIDGFTARILKSMLFRDAIRGALATMQEAIGDFMAGNARLAGGPPSKGFHPLTALGDWIGDSLLGGESMLPGMQDARFAAGQSAASAINAKNLQDQQLQQFRENPGSLGESTSDLQDSLSKIIDQRSAAARGNAITQATEIGQVPSREAQERFEVEDKRMAAEEQHARELLSIAKERDKKESERAPRMGSFGIDGGNAFMEGQIRKEAEEAAKKAAEHEKRVQERAISDKESLIVKSQGGIDKDLNFTEKLLREQKATSAVTINGGLYGRNDSAAALVQHAAQQTNLLRSIDTNIKALRAQHSELTLL